MRPVEFSNVKDTTPEPNSACFYTHRSAWLLMIALNTIIGVAYVYLQWSRHGRVHDSVFVGLLLGATVILMIGFRSVDRFIERRALEFLTFLMTRSNPRDQLGSPVDLTSSLFNTRRMTACGLLYGAAIGSAPFILHVWKGDFALRGILTVFLFGINFSTGVGFCGLVTFLISAAKLGHCVVVDIWDRENPSTEYLVGAAQRIALFASIYISICTVSVLFSVLPLGGFVIGYCVFAGSLIVIAFVIPIWPIARKLSVVKRAALQDVSLRVQNEFQRITEQLKSEDTAVDLSRFQRLIELRNTVEAVNVWPFRLKLVSTIGSVVFVSALPVLLQFTLQKLF